MTPACRKREYSLILTEYDSLRIQEEVGHWLPHFKNIPNVL